MAIASEHQTVPVLVAYPTQSASVRVAVALSPLALCGYVCLLSGGGVCLTSENVHAIIGGTNLDKWKCQRNETNASKAASRTVRQST